MNLPFHDTKNKTLLQAVSNNWDNKIASFLPKHLDLILKQSGCVKRFRGVSCAVDLLKAVLLYSVFSMLSTAMHALSIASISDTAWKKRFSCFAPFLQLFLSHLLASLVPTSPRPIFFVDASMIRQLHIFDPHTAESLLHFSMKPGDIFLANAGYGTAKNYAYTREQKADVILRITPNNFSIYDVDGKKIDVLTFLKEEKGNHKRTIWMDSIPEETILCSYPSSQTTRGEGKRSKETETKKSQ